MSKIWAAILIMSLMISPLYARDTKSMHSIKGVFESADGKDKLDKDIRFYFGKQPHPKVEKSFGEFRTNKKTNAFGKSDKQACGWAFLSALLVLQSRAIQEGGNAVVNIRSNYRNNEVESETEFECGAGAVMAGVALKGDVVKLGK